MFLKERDCVRFLFRIRWPEMVACPYCGSSQIVHLTSRYRTYYHRYVCKTCTRKLGRKRTFTELTGTIFAGTKIPLTKWFKAGCLLGMGKSTAAIARAIGVSQVTAKRMVRLLAGSPYLRVMGEADADYG